MFTTLSDVLVPWHSPLPSSGFYGYEFWVIGGAALVGVVIAFIISRNGAEDERPGIVGTIVNLVMGAVVGGFIGFFGAFMASAIREREERYEARIDSLQQWFGDEYGIELSRERTEEISEIAAEYDTPVDTAFNVSLDEKDTLVRFQVVEPDESGRKGYLLSNAEGALIEQK